MGGRGWNADRRSDGPSCERRAGIEADIWAREAEPGGVVMRNQQVAFPCSLARLLCNPEVAYDTDRTVAEGHRRHREADLPPRAQGSRVARAHRCPRVRD